LIIGAGPAGTAAAYSLARRGARVVLADQSTFPREKVCGDALVPDALAALARLGLKAPVAARMKRMQGIRVYVPDGSFVSLEAELGCLPRMVLDDVLLQAATAAGADVWTPARVVAPVVEGGKVVGAEFMRGTDEPIEVRATATLIATGAAAKPLQLFGLCKRSEASATAARRYYRVPEPLAQSFDFLCIAYEKSICPGYGWVFPGPDGVFNIGVGYFYDSPRRPTETNVRLLLERFLQTFPPARELVAVSTPITPLRGAPLRTALRGARVSAPGVLVIGEAAGLTYPFSGEGIGKALESGMLAADVIADHAEADAAAVAEAYRVALHSTYDSRFRAYKLAQDWLSRPWVANFVAKRARANPGLRRALEGVLTEQLDPRTIFSPTSLIRVLLP
jgi:geranylgeranyl reductase family protein